MSTRASVQVPTGRRQCVLLALCRAQPAHRLRRSCTSYRLVGGADRVAASDSKTPTPHGALKTLASQPFGKVLLWLCGRLVALALWQASEAIWGYRNREGAERVRSRSQRG